MITLSQLKELAKQNSISYTCLNKDEIIAMLIEKNIITTSDIFKQKCATEKPIKQKPIKCHEMDKNKYKQKYKHLEGIRNNPKTVEVFDRDTDVTSIYTSKYKAGRMLRISPSYFKDGSILKDRYQIKVV